MSDIRKIAVLTSGGDAPGMNSAVRAVVVSAINSGIEIVGTILFTTGASNDIEQATKLARAMITRYGMSDRFGMVALETQNNPYLGGDSSLSCSPQTAADIDQMVVDTVKHGYDTAMELLEKNQKKLHELAKYLYEKETITGEEFMQILTRTETLEEAEGK